MTEETHSSEFIPFPQSTQARMDAAADARKPYESPHHPMRRPAATGLVEDQGLSDLKALVAPTIPVQAPTQVTPVAEPEAISLALPSRFAFYSCRDLYASPFKGRALAKLHRAKQEESTLHLVEAVSSVLSNSAGEQALGFKLTPNDFYFVLYWLRLNSFAKSAFIHNTTCTNADHINKVGSGELAPETLRISEVITKSTMETKELEEVPNVEAYPLVYPNIRLKICTMRDIVEITEHPQIADEEFGYLAGIAAWIDSAAGGLSLDERIKIVEDMSGDDIATVQAYEKAFAEYGIQERVRVTCKTCGHSRIDKVELEAHNFFPSAA